MPLRSTPHDVSKIKILQVSVLYACSWSWLHARAKIWPKLRIHVTHDKKKKQSKAGNYIWLWCRRGSGFQCDSYVVNHLSNFNFLFFTAAMKPHRDTTNNSTNLTWLKYSHKLKHELSLSKNLWMLKNTYINTSNKLGGMMSELSHLILSLGILLKDIQKNSQKRAEKGL